MCLAGSDISDASHVAQPSELLITVLLVQYTQQTQQTWIPHEDLISGHNLMSAGRHLFTIKMAI